MKVKVKLSQPFSGVAGKSELLVSPEKGDLGSLLRKLCSDYPRMGEHVFDKEGKVLDHLNIFVNQVAVTSDKETTMPLRDGDEVMIMVAVAGG